MIQFALLAVPFDPVSQLVVADVQVARGKLDALIKIAPNSDGAVFAKELLASLPARP